MSTPIQTPFVVPFADKDAVKALGARWNPSLRAWCAQDAAMADTMAAHWPRARPDPFPALLPGEDRSAGGSDLFVDLVPRSCWFSNARSCLSPTDWHWVHNGLLARANSACEICGAHEDKTQSPPVYLDAHERWAFSDLGGVQTLRRLILLCARCHEVTHFGLAEVKGRRAEALAHLMRVRGWERGQAEDHIAAAYDLWFQRSTRDWMLDLSILTDAGCTVVKPERGVRRAA